MYGVLCCSMDIGYTHTHTLLHTNLKILFSRQTPFCPPCVLRSFSYSSPSLWHIETNTPTATSSLLRLYSDLSWEHSQTHRTDVAPTFLEGNPVPQQVSMKSMTQITIQKFTLKHSLVLVRLVFRLNPKVVFCFVFYSILCPTSDSHNGHNPGPMWMP